MYEVFEMLCKSKGVTPYKVCKATGITTATISSWKAGRYTPKQEKLQKIADYFEVSLDFLMNGENSADSETYYLNPETAQAAQEIYQNKELRALFDVQRDMEPEDLRALYDMALALKRKERGNIDDTGC